MSVALFFSGGKDGFHCLQRDPSISHLLTTFDDASGRLPIQGLRIEVIRLQAAALDRPLVAVPLPAGADNVTWAATLTDAIVGHGFERLVFGDLHLADIRAFRERALAGTGCELSYPLWTTDTRALAEEMLASGLRCRVCSVLPGRLGRRYLDRPWDRRLLDDLPAGVDPCGENGEFHTVVTGGPGMRPIALRPRGRVQSFGYDVQDYLPA